MIVLTNVNRLSIVPKHKIVLTVQHPPERISLYAVMAIMDGPIIALTLGVGANRSSADTRHDRATALKYARL